MQLAQERRRIGEAVRRLLGEHPVDHGGQRLRHVRPLLLERLGRLIQVLHRHRQRRVALVRRRAGEHVIGRHAERIDVAAAIERPALDLLGAHVERRSHRHADLREIQTAVALHARQPEVGHLHLAAAGEHDVLRLDVAVDDPLARSLHQGRRHLPQNIERQRRLQSPAAANHFAQVAARHVFLRDEVHAVALPDFIDLHDPRMHQRRRRPGFVMKPLDVDGIAGEVGAEHLERHLPTQRELLGQIDLGHRPLAELPQHAVVFQCLANQYAQTISPRLQQIACVSIVICRATLDQPGRWTERGWRSLV